jgi:hypothetical protein
MSDQITLSAIDFLGLAEQCRVARVNLADVGYQGVVYVRDLSAAKQQEVLTRPQKGKTRVYADKSMDIDWRDLPADAGPKFLAAAMVTGKNGLDLEKAFQAVDEPYIVLSVDEIEYMYDQWASELGSKSRVMDKLSEMPNAVVNEIVRRVREISGMGDDEEDAVEKKGRS